MFPAATVVWLEQTEEPLTDIKCVTCRVKLGIARWLDFVEYFFYGTISKVCDYVEKENTQSEKPYVPPP